MKTFIANLLWFLGQLPGLLRFQISCMFPGWTQRRILKRLLRRNRDTEFCRERNIKGLSDFSAAPLTTAADYEASVTKIRQGKTGLLTTEPVTLLEPTSGSRGGTKLIPYTKSLAAEFQAALSPWLAKLYLTFPGLLGGKQYWSISPSTPVKTSPDDRVPIGFADDAEYLGPLARRLASAVLAVPSDVRYVHDESAFAYVTLLFLLRERNLRLISVWHPSFLTLLLKRLPALRESLISDIRKGTLSQEVKINADVRLRLQEHLRPDPARADELLDCPTSAEIWPNLLVISCWAGPTLAAEVELIRRLFPNAFIQPKGLLATEGVVTIPWGKSGKMLPAICSHYLEFRNATSGDIVGIADLECGREYSVIMTTGGGLYRYQLNDLVRVSKGALGLPSLEFVRRDGVVSDRVGEKLHLEHVEMSLQQHRFAFLAPERTGDTWGYVLYVETDAPPLEVRDKLESTLRENYHYAHAQNLGQLHELRVFSISDNAAELFRREKARRCGCGLGDVKFVSLEVTDGWLDVFPGQFVEEDVLCM